jgi:hypothetical protein
MTKKTRKLALRRETVRALANMDLARAVGGFESGAEQCPHAAAVDSGDFQCPLAALAPASLLVKP